MKETCPLCFKSFPLEKLERHVNTCLDSNNPGAEGDAVKATPKKDKTDVFAAMGLKADSKGSAEKGKKDGMTLTSILLAEKRLRKKQEELDRKIKEEQSREAETGNTQKPAVVETKPFLEAGNPGIGPDASLSEVLGEITPTSSQGGENEPNSEIVTENAPLVPLLLDTRAARARDEMAKLRRESELPLAHRLRPTSLDDFFGQEKLAGENGILRNFITSKNIPSFILWGVPGVGKTSLARIIASASQHRFVELSGTESNAKKLKETFVMAQNERQRSGVKTILFLDEIHRFNKAVQDLLLPAIEKGVLTVIGATTENPSFSLNNALLSRMHTFVMEPLSHEALVRILSKGLLLLNKSRKFVQKLHLIAFDKDALDYVAHMSAGDSRVALNLLESVNAYLSGLQFRTIQVEDAENEKIKLPDTTGIIKVSLAELKPFLKTRNFQQAYDRNGDNHYDAISAFHKSVRGSDADAAVFYLVKMLQGGEDPLFIARRMIVIASEDIGLRDSLCLPFAIAVLEALQFIGMPEGEIILAHAAVKLARAPKSTKLYRALRNAQALFKKDPNIAQLPVPMHLRNAATSLMKELGYGEHYKYNPLYQHGLTIQLFLPPEVDDLRLVEDTHLGQSRDEAVEESRYDALEKKDQEYRRFKKLRKSVIMQHMSNDRKASKASSALGELSSDAAERLSSYDENLGKDAQPDYFDGTEQDKYSQGELDEPY